MVQFRLVFGNSVQLAIHGDIDRSTHCHRCSFLYSWNIQVRGRCERTTYPTKSTSMIGKLRSAISQPPTPNGIRQDNSKKLCPSRSKSARQCKRSRLSTTNYNLNIPHPYQSSYQPPVYAYTVISLTKRFPEITLHNSLLPSSEWMQPEILSTSVELA